MSRQREYSLDRFGKIMEYLASRRLKNRGKRLGIEPLLEERQPNFTLSGRGDIFPRDISPLGGKHGPCPDNRA